MDLYEDLHLKAKEGNGFVSISDMQEIMTIERVREYFKSSDYQSILFEAFIPAGRKLLAVLIYSGLENYIEQFRNYSDEIFPVNESDDNSTLPIENRKNLYKFCRSQWEIAPFLNTRVHLDPGEREHIDFKTLFFEQPGKVEKNDGSSGVVKQVKMRKGHIEGYPTEQVSDSLSSHMNITHTNCLREALRTENYSCQ